VGAHASTQRDGGAKNLKHEVVGEDLPYEASFNQGKKKHTL